jgi:cytochrome c peroxidase
MSEVKVELGRHLFHDRRLSGNGTQSCASCHRPELAFTDGQRTAIGSTGEKHFRNSMSLANVGYGSSLTWADASVRSLEAQAIVPITNRAPVEMGMAGRESELLRRIESDPTYRRLFRDAFPDDPSPVSIPNLTRAIASFERTILSFDSPYDRFVFRGDVNALSPEAWHGMQLFFSERTKCGECHSGLNLAGPSRTPDSRPEPTFHHTALYAIGTERSYPATDNGLRRVTHRPEDDGRFKVPTLRNVAVTAPYMHDGSIATLEEVVDHYARGGRASENPGKSALLRGFTLTPDEKAALIAFLESLTDEKFLADPGYADPWTGGS